MKSSKQIVPEAFETYCNPISLPDIPYGGDEDMLGMQSMCNERNYEANDEPDYRSMADPTVKYYDNKWYLYPSYGMAWVTEDFKRWKHVRTNPYCPKYAPAITKWGDKFLLTASDCPLYVSDDPLGPFTILGDIVLPDGTICCPADPELFTDDDGRIYMYGYGGEPLDGKGIHTTMVVGYELDQKDPTKIIQGPITLFKMNPKEHWWERFGFHNEDTRFGWVEGAHMLKHNGRYYCMYGTPCTQNGAYCMAVYYSEHPLEGFVCQKKNPLTHNRYGTVSGTGHGCVVCGPNDTLWAFYTVAVCHDHKFERRIGMDLVAVDENGELYCPHGVTETPQYIPGYSKNPVECNSPGYVHLNGFNRATATSHKPGREPIYATDESNLTWWEPNEDDERPVLTCQLGVPYYIGSVRVFWRETGLCYKNGIVPGRIGYILEGHWNGEWFKLTDNSDETEELNIDYRAFKPQSCDAVRLTITEKPKGINPGVIDFTVFGTRDMER